MVGQGGADHTPQSCAAVVAAFILGMAVVIAAAIRERGAHGPARQALGQISAAVVVDVRAGGPGNGFIMCHEVNVKPRMVVLAGIYWVIVTFNEQGRCFLGRLTGSPLPALVAGHSTPIPGSRKHDRPPERPWFATLHHAQEDASGQRNVDQRSGAAPHYCRQLRRYEVNPSVERMPAGWPTTSTLPHGKNDNRSFLWRFFCLTCGASAVH